MENKRHVISGTLDYDERSKFWSDYAAMARKMIYV